MFSRFQLIDALITAISIVSFLLIRHEWSRYISPVIAILLSYCFIRGSVRRLSLSANELINAGVPVQQQDEIVDILLSHRSACVKRIADIRCYILDRRLNIAVGVSYKEEATYQQQTQALRVWRDAVHERYPGSIIRVEFVD